MFSLFRILIAVGALALSFRPISGNGWFSWVRGQAHAIKSIDDQVRTAHKDAIGATKSLSQLKIPVQRYIAHTYTSQYQNIFSEIFPHLSIENCNNLQRYAYERPTLYTPKIIYDAQTPFWVTSLFEQVIEKQIQLPVQQLNIECNTLRTCAKRTNENRATLSFNTNTLSVGYADRNKFYAIALHELAHITLQHAYIRRIASIALKTSAINGAALLKKLNHLHEFQADSYYTSYSAKTTDHLREYLMVLSTLHNDINTEYDTHPSLKRRIDALTMQAALLKSA